MFCCGCLFKFNSTYKGEGCQSPQLDGSYWLRSLETLLNFLCHFPVSILPYSCLRLKKKQVYKNYVLKKEAAVETPANKPAYWTRASRCSIFTLVVYYLRFLSKENLAFPSKRQFWSMWCVSIICNYCHDVKNTLSALIFILVRWRIFTCKIIRQLVVSW